MTRQKPFVFKRFRNASLLVAALFFTTGMDGTACPTTNVPNVPGGPNTPGGPQVISSDHVLGDNAAPVTVIEYSDLQCPFCGAFDRTQFPMLQSMYIDTGKVRYVYRHFPLDSVHPNARAAAEASECAADQDLFFEFIHAVFADQSDLSADGLRDLAETAGLNLTQYDACIAADGKEARVNQDVASGTALGVSGTPTFYVNGVAANSNTVFDEIDRQLDALGVDD